MTQSPSTHPAIGPSQGSALPDDDFTGGPAAAERYRHGCWQGQQDRKLRRLELRDDGRGGRYYLDGRPIHNGDQLEIQFADGQWHELRIEVLPAEILGYGLLPTLAGGYELVAKVPSKALLRWPALGKPR
jgi:hypothetical protein